MKLAATKELSLFSTLHLYRYIRANRLCNLPRITSTSPRVRVVGSPKSRRWLSDSGLNSLLKSHEKPVISRKSITSYKRPFFLMIIVHIVDTVFFSSQYCLITWWLLGMTLGLERQLPPMFSLCKCGKWKKWRDTNIYQILVVTWLEQRNPVEI